MVVEQIEADHNSHQNGVVENEELAEEPDTSHAPESVFEHMPIISPTISPSQAISLDTFKESLTETGFSGVEQVEQKRNQLPGVLPVVECIARARIPTTQGPEIFLHLYSNNIDNKEHLAIVFGEDIRSRSLFRKRAGETQSDRMTRGAYVGKLYPGRKTAEDRYHFIHHQTGNPPHELSKYIWAFWGQSRSFAVNF